MSSRISDKNPFAVQDLIKKLSQKASITVGIHAEQGDAPKKEFEHKIGPVREGATGKEAGWKARKQESLDVATVAAAHEFGIGTVPRPFVSGWVDEHSAEVQPALAKVLAAIIKTGKGTIEDAAKRFGLWAAGQMQKRMADGIPPALSPERLAEKAQLTGQEKATPLILTGQLRSSIRSKVEIGK